MVEKGGYGTRKDRMISKVPWRVNSTGPFERQCGLNFRFVLVKGQCNWRIYIPAHRKECTFPDTSGLIPSKKGFKNPRAAHPPTDTGASYWNESAGNWLHRNGKGFEGIQAEHQKCLL